MIGRDGPRANQWRDLVNIVYPVPNEVPKYPGRLLFSFTRFRQRCQTATLGTSLLIGKARVPGSIYLPSRTAGYVGTVCIGRIYANDS